MAVCSARCYGQVVRSGFRHKDVFPFWPVQGCFSAVASRNKDAFPPWSVQGCFSDLAGNLQGSFPGEHPSEDHGIGPVRTALPPSKTKNFSW
jgi:hypothetical protein